MKKYDKFHFFYGGPFSQWLPCEFVVEGVKFNCAEQYMMAGKAKLFGDYEMLAKIMASDSPYQQKMEYGRNVRNFDLATWNKHCQEIVYNANKAKFDQNSELYFQLMLTKGELLVEASPTDRIWGIGMGEGAVGIENPDNWKGTNWLGEVLTKLREDFILLSTS